MAQIIHGDNPNNARILKLELPAESFLEMAHGLVREVCYGNGREWLMSDGSAVPFSDKCIEIVGIEFDEMSQRYRLVARDERATNATDVCSLHWVNTRDTGKTG